MYEAALKLRDEGLSIIVLGDDKSRPLGKWKQFQSEIITAEELQRLCNYKTAKNIAIIGGNVSGFYSGQLCQMDFDDHKNLGCVFDEWFQLVRKEFDEYFCELLVIHKTPHNGYHVRWRVESKETLASRDIAARWIVDPKTAEIKEEVDTIIELRAEREYALCPPSPGYKVIQGSLLEIPMISCKSHQRLVAIAEMFHTAIKNPPPEPELQTKKSRKSDGLSPGDDFNERGDYQKILTKHGWTLVHSTGDKAYWKHPTTEHATSATWNCMPELPDRFYCFSPNTPFEQKKPYHRFAIYATLECDGDFTLASKTLAAEGYGEQREPEAEKPKQRTTKRQPILLTGEDRYIEIKALIEQHFRKGTKPDKIFGVAKDRNEKRCQPPIPDDEIIALINSLKPRLPTQTGTQLLAKDIPPPKWAVEDFIPEGLTIFAGKPKIGKSWMMLGISLAVALGGKALGEIGVEGGDVLYCALEDNERRLQNRLEILLPDGASPDRFHYIALGDLPKMDRGGLDMIGTFLDDMPNTRMVVIDTLQKFKAHGNSKRNMYEEDYDIFGVLQNFAMGRGIAMVLVHHMRKADADYELDEISGSTGATGASDSILILKRTVDGPTLYRQGRDVLEHTFAVNFDESDCTWTILGDAKEVVMSEARMSIIQMLEGSPNGLTAKAISGALNKPHGSVKGMLSKMVSDGLLFNINTHYVIKQEKKVDIDEDVEVFDFANS